MLGKGLWKGDVELGRTSAKSLVWDTLQERKKAPKKPERDSKLSHHSEFRAEPCCRVRISF